MFLRSPGAQATQTPSYLSSPANHSRRYSLLGLDNIIALLHMCLGHGRHDTLPPLFHKSNLRFPAIAVPGIPNLRIQAIYLLESESLRFIYEEVHEYNAEEAAGAPDEENFSPQASCTRGGIHEIGGGKADGPVEDPVAGNRACNRFSADTEREDLAL